MPGMRLTPQQVERLAGVDRSTCQSVLEDLVRAGFLCISETGSYGRPSDASLERARFTREQAAVKRMPTPSSGRFHLRDSIGKP